MIILSQRRVAALLVSLSLCACGGGGGGSDDGSGSPGGSSAGQTGTGSTPDVVATTALVAKLGKPSRVLIGLGAGNTLAQMQSQDIHPDVVDIYLVGVGAGAWPTWNSPDGAYITYTAQAIRAYGATPMYTLYQMAQDSDGTLNYIANTTFMNNYWAQVRLMYQRLAAFDAPALVNLEPDFWGFVWAQSPGHDPTRLPAVVSSQAECSGLPNTAAGVGQCLLKMGRQIAPKALLGFPPSFWGTSPATIGAEMHAVGAQRADFIVAQTSDRDAGCWEASPPPAECVGRSGPFYWDASNLATPNFHQSQSAISDYRAALGGGLPILWWQTPMGEPSTTPGGTDLHYRDNRVDYMLRNTEEYGAIHTFAIVFSSGGGHQTSINTDRGQFARLFGQYLARNGTALQ